MVLRASDTSNNFATTVNQIAQMIEGLKTKLRTANTTYINLITLRGQLQNQVAQAQLLMQNLPDPCCCLPSCSSTTSILLTEATSTGQSGTTSKASGTSKLTWFLSVI